MTLSHVTDWERFNEVLKFTRLIKDDCRPFSELLDRRKELAASLVGICRHCKDIECPSDCEVRKAYRALYP